VIEGRNILCIASDWSYDPTSKHHIMKRLAERNEIIWVNYHGSRRPKLSASDFGAVMGKLRRVVQGPRRVDRHVTVVTPLVVPMPGSAVVSRLNRRLLTRQIRRVLQDLPRRPVQLWSFAPDVDYLCGRFGEECVVYYCVDEFSEFAGYDRRAILSAERRLATKADLVVTTSQALFDAKGPLNANTVLVPHGVDYSHFAKATLSDTAVPADIAGLPRPILGFWGLVQGWVDVGLIRQLAVGRPDWSVVLIGEVATDVSALRELPNVYLLGRRPYASLPGYARGFDAGLIPFRVDALTRAVNPIKLREYLSAGLPVVSTPLPEVRRYAGLVRVAEAGDEYIAACDEVLGVCRETAGTVHSVGDVQVAARQTAMRGETWAAKVEEVCCRLQTCLVGRYSGASRRGEGALHDSGISRLPGEGEGHPRWKSSSNGEIRAD